jgi:hypothetical protein
VPALDVPLENKDEYVCPKNHIDALVESLSQVDRMLVIGWRATERKFLALAADRLSKSLDRYLVACADADASSGSWLNILIPW